jgi:hypothetical protein
VRLLVFAVVATCAMVISYGLLGLGGPVCALIFLFILFNGALDRLAQPLLQKLRP